MFLMIDKVSKGFVAWGCLSLSFLAINSVVTLHTSRVTGHSPSLVVWLECGLPRAQKNTSNIEDHPLRSRFRS